MFSLNMKNFPNNTTAQAEDIKSKMVRVFGK
jgi:hypothetical protein